MDKPLRSPLSGNGEIDGENCQSAQEGGLWAGYRVCDRAGNTMGNVVEIKKLIALPSAALDLGRIVGGLKIVSDGDDGQQNCGERAKRDELHRNRGKQRPALRPAFHLAPLGAPESPKSNGDGQPSEVAEQFHRLQGIIAERSFSFV